MNNQTPEEILEDKIYTDTVEDKLYEVLPSMVDEDGN